MKKRVHVFYVGRVQGVGFRMTAEEVAQRLGVVGWIKNLRDGRVELVVEGEEEILSQFLDDLRTGPMRNFIHTVQISWGASLNTFEGFEVRYR